MLVRVRACGVCRTDLHVVDGELPDVRVPVVPGHEVVGTIEQAGEGIGDVAVGERVGIPWLGYSCGVCEYCRAGSENLCPYARYTGYQIDGGYAEYALADARFVFPLPEAYGDLEAAPLLCAGLIGYRAYRIATREPGALAVRRLGIYGFGAAAHIIAQVAVHDGREVYAFTSPGDRRAQQFALGLGATWAGASTDAPPAPLDAAILFAPVGPLVPEALRRLRPGGIVVCAGIHMSDIPSFAYRPPLAGTRGPIGREPHARRRARVSPPCAEGACEDAHPPVSARRREPRAERSAVGRYRRRRRAGAMTSQEHTVADRLAELGIVCERYEHPPVATVDDAREHWAAIDAVHCKNLFLRNPKGDRHYLVVLLDSKRADLRRIAEQIGDGRLSFGSPERLMRKLGVTPGSVSPFGLINDTERDVRVVIDEDLKHADRLTFHPNINTLTYVISGADFRRFLDACGNPVRYLSI